MRGTKNPACNPMSVSPLGGVLRLGARLTPEEVRRVLEARSATAMEQLQHPNLIDVGTLLGLFAESPQGVSFSRLQKAMGGRKGKSGHGALAAKASKYARLHLKHPFDGKEYLWASLWVDRGGRGRGADPLIVMVWQHSKNLRARAPTPPPLEFSAPSDVTAPVSYRATAAVTDPALQPDHQHFVAPLWESRGKLLAPTSLDELLHPYRADVADHWLGVRCWGRQGWNLVADAVAGANTTTTAPNQIFVRCIPIRVWGERVGRDLVEAINRCTVPQTARLFVVQPGRPVDLAADEGLVSFCGPGGTPRAAVIFLSGYRPVHQIADLVHSIRRGGSKVTIIVFGYATSSELARLRGWHLLEVSPPSGSTVGGTHAIPAELDRAYSPLTRLLTRPECHGAYPWAGDGAQPPVPSEWSRWRLTFSAVREFIERNCGDVRLEVLANAWAARVLQHPPEESVRFLYDSGLVFPDLRDLDGKLMARAGSAVSGAVSAYLDGVLLASADRSHGIGEKLFRATLDSARSGRRLPIDLIPDLQQLTSWLALLVSVHEAPDGAAAAGIINDVGALDANIAFDLHAIRTQVTRPDVPVEDVVRRFLEHGRSHGNAIPLLFPASMDFYPHPHGPLIGPPPLITSGSEIIGSMPDAEVMATVLASCSIVAECDLLALSHAVMLPTMRLHLQAVGTRLRRDAIRIREQPHGRHVYVSMRPLSIEDLEPAFPGIRRYHRRGTRTALVPWLSAYLLAAAVGGKLPTEGQFRRIAADPRVQSTVIDNTAPSLPMLPHFNSEWLVSTSPPDPVRGSEFQGERPSFFDRRVAKANWQQPDLRMQVVFADVPSAELTARPDREKLAACRVVFEDSPRPA